MKTAILVDGGFYRRKAQQYLGPKPYDQSANDLFCYCMRHLSQRKGSVHSDLYRIFYYDCPPVAKKIYHPFLKKQIDLAKTDTYEWMNGFLNELKSKRKIALRLGQLSDTQAHYILNQDALKDLCNEKRTFHDLSENDFCLNIEQKGVDMKIGLDISSLAFKKQVDQIVLISGDSDFVPAAKHARREGIDFILDPLGADIKPNLFEHIDGLRSCSLYNLNSYNNL